MAVQGVFPVLAKTEAYLVSVRLSLLCLTEVAFFSQLKAKPSISKKITTRFIASSSCSSSSSSSSTTRRNDSE